MAHPESAPCAKNKSTIIDVTQITVLRFPLKQNCNCDCLRTRCMRLERGVWWRLHQSPHRGCITQIALSRFQNGFELFSVVATFRSRCPTVFFTMTLLEENWGHLWLFMSLIFSQFNIISEQDIGYFLSYMTKYIYAMSVSIVQYIGCYIHKADFCMDVIPCDVNHRISFGFVCLLI